MDGDDDMMSMIIELYNEEHGNDIQMIQEKYANSDMDGLFHTVHSLKGVLLTLCEENASELFELSEVNIHYLRYSKHLHFSTYKQKECHY